MHTRSRAAVKQQEHESDAERNVLRGRFVLNPNRQNVSNRTLTENGWNVFEVRADAGILQNHFDEVKFVNYISFE